MTRSRSLTFPHIPNMLGQNSLYLVLQLRKHKQLKSKWTACFLWSEKWKRNLKRGKKKHGHPQVERSLEIDYTYAAFSLMAKFKQSFSGLPKIRPVKWVNERIHAWLQKKKKHGQFYQKGSNQISTTNHKSEVVDWAGNPWQHKH